MVGNERGCASGFAARAHCLSLPPLPAHLVNDTHTMEGWAKFQSSIAQINLGAAGAGLGQSAGKLTKGFNSTLQQAKGEISPPVSTHRHSDRRRASRAGKRG
jgi:hypothetical protein